MNKLKKIYYYFLVLKHKRTPLISKLLLAAAVIYTFFPFDVVPDFIPLSGQIDDIAVLSGVIYLALLFVPDDIKENVKKKLK